MLTRQSKTAFLTRYINILPMGIYAFGAPVPVSRAGLLWCTGGALAATALLHGYAARTGRWRNALYAVSFFDIFSIGVLVYLTGFVTSPFLILMALPFGVAYFVDRDRRVVIILAASGIAWMCILFAAWWIRGPEIVGWSPHAYPAFTVLVFVLQLLAIVGTAAQAFDLPEPLVSDLDRQKAELERQAHRAALGTSLAVIAHEIRTPLTTMTFSLRAALDQLKSPEGPGATRALRHLQSTEEELGRVNRMLEGLLSYAREKRGRMRPAPHRPLALFNRAIEFVRLASQPGHRQVPAEAETETARLVRCDADAMHQILVNLLDNAMQHAAPGRPLRVHLRAVDRGEEVALIVRDNGTGIPPGRAGRLFEEYGTDRVDGTGLGLSIARQLVRDQGGAIAVEETPGGGATFVITLAAATEEAPGGSGGAL